MPIQISLLKAAKPAAESYGSRSGVILALGILFLFPFGPGNGSTKGRRRERLTDTQQDRRREEDTKFTFTPRLRVPRRRRRMGTVRLFSRLFALFRVGGGRRPGKLWARLLLPPNLFLSVSAKGICLKRRKEMQETVQDPFSKGHACIKLA